MMRENRQLLKLCFAHLSWDDDGEDEGIRDEEEKNSSTFFILGGVKSIKKSSKYRFKSVLFINIKDGEPNF